jgi:hypothetical protein
MNELRFRYWVGSRHAGLSNIYEAPILTIELARNFAATHLNQNTLEVQPKPHQMPLIAARFT